jgi:hypothetical protein
VSSFAPAATRLGRLQRGRGAGGLQACRDGALAREDVLACIVADPRLDPQVESRSRYYAEIALWSAAPVAPIVRAADHGEPGSLAVEVLAELAVCGQPDARWLLDDPRGAPELRRQLVGYLRDYPAWSAKNLPLSAVADLAAALHAADDLVVDVAIYRDFWLAWAGRIGDVADAFAVAAAEEAAEQAGVPEAPGDPSAMSTSALLDFLEAHASSVIQVELAHRTSPEDRALLAWRVEHGESARLFAAADALAKMGDPRLLDLAEALFALPDEPAEPTRRFDAALRSRRAALCRYAASLPGAMVLPLARAWWHRGGYFRQAAARVMAQHAEPGDRGWLESAVLDRQMVREPLVAVDGLAALRRIGDVRTGPVFMSVYDGTGSSFVRSRALAGLCGQPTATGAAERVEEALWDCEADARELAVVHASSGRSRVRSRVRELAAHPLAGEGA